MSGNAVERRGSRAPGAVLLGALDFFPVGPDLAHGLHLRSTEDVGVSANQFVGDKARDVFEIERATLSSIRPKKESGILT